MLKETIKNALAGTGCSREEAVGLIRLDEAELLRGATQIREARFGKTVQLCAIVNAKSGQCDMDCSFCSQSGQASTEIEQYPFMPPAELAPRMEAILENNDCRCSVVTSGMRSRRRRSRMYAPALPPKRPNSCCRQTRSTLLSSRKPAARW